jgi:hypothetical protein
MKRLTAVLSVLALVMATTIGLFSVTTAEATVGPNNYCGQLTQPMTSCSQTSGSQYTGSAPNDHIDNEAYYQGSGYISLCQKIVNSAATEVNRTCNPASCDCNYTNSPDTPVNNDFVVGYAGNNSANAHTINGQITLQY